METRLTLVAFLALCWTSGSANLLPVFTHDMNNLALSESTPVGAIVYRLQGVDPEALQIKYSLVGTDKFSVNPETGDVTLKKALDREVEDTIKFLVSIEDQAPDDGDGGDGGVQNLVQSQPVTVIVTDENDNPPLFSNSPYEVDVPEDEAVGTTILRGIRVEDQDSVGDNLEVDCVVNEQWPEACSTFEVVTLNASAHEYIGALVLRRPLSYNNQQFYQLQLVANDGTLNSTAHVEVKVQDVQNSPPVFTGALNGALLEDAPVGTLALTVKARDADRAQPRDVVLELITNPLDFFLLDATTGELRTAKPLDRALADPSSPLNLTVRATEIVNGSPLVSALTSTLATVTITIKDVNDEPPRFNRREYALDIPESLPQGTPLPHLDMLVTDTDVGLNSVFTLRLSNEFGAFVVEPSQATGSARVTLRLNSTLDYEDPNQRKFILEVIAEELHTSPRLSSKASVTVSVSDVNDNAPVFSGEPYSASVAEGSPAGARVTALTATDRDTGRFGSAGIIYELSGNGADLFTVDKRSGVILVAPCESPGHPPCLDYETRKDYFLQYKATDDDGAGQSTVVSLQISLTDSNDNPPVFSTAVYKASIDEDATKFEPELQVQARDVDATSEIRYSIVDPASHEFWIDPLSGRVSVRPSHAALRANETRIVLTVLATDGVHNATCRIEILVRDVNNHAPVFDTDRYDADISEDAPIGTEVAAVRATDLDSGVNAELKYTIQKGALESFSIDNVTGVVSVASKLDYDKRNTYRIQIVATDSGIPHQTGTTELTVHVINVNDKPPVFTPPTQRAAVSADAPPATELHVLAAMDPDILDQGDLSFERDVTRVVKAVDRNGKEVTEEGIFNKWFSVLRNGSVVVSQQLDRSRAAVVTLPVAVSDTSASAALQRAEGELIITIVDVNRHAPVFSEPSYYVTVAEEQPIGTTLGTFPATDKETPIAAILINPPSEYFTVDNVTGTVKSTKRIDFEKIKLINFTLTAYDSGVPQLATAAGVTVEVTNVNDEEPMFAADAYDAAVDEGAAGGTRVVTVTAVDKDEGEFGEVTYSLSGDNASLFTIDPHSGVVTVAAVLDRESTPDLYLRAVASDNAPLHLRRSTSVPVHIKVRDVNDNAPAFSQKVYKSTISENLQLNPPAAILQIRAEDRDEGDNGNVAYSIDTQTQPGVFTVDPSNGIIYPSKPVAGNTSYTLTVTARDGAGSGPNADTARVDIFVLSVNKHSPVFVHPPADVRQITIPENAAQADYLITTIQATDEDSGENGRISYYLKVDNLNVGETAEFSLDKDSGELRTKTFLDREHKAEYQLVIAAVDNGTPAQFSSLRLLAVVLADDDDNAPRFPHPHYTFTIAENQPPQRIVGTVKATDKDSGDNGKVYYHILEGNQERAFTLDRLQGTIKSNISFDREKQSDYTFTIYASNSPLFSPAEALNSIDNNTDSADSITSVTVNVLDENDNAPSFQQTVYYAGIKHTARVNEPIISVVASDPDLEENGTLAYMVAASNLYTLGASQASGSVVPSPFNITQDGVLMTAHYMSEYNQDRFVLDIIAQETAPPHRRARAQVYIWIIDRSSLIRMVVSRSCASSVDEVKEKLAEAGNALLVLGRRLPLVQADTKYDDWCEIHLHAVERGTWQVLPVQRVLEHIDAQYDRLQHTYTQYGVETLQATATASKAPDTFDPALAALIALLIVLFTGIITFVVVCACLKHWVIPPPSMQSSKGDSLARRRILEELSTTENPLWLESKLRPYEEQELTMNVFGDQNEQQTQESVQPDNTYATIQGSRPTERFGDYATLGGDSPTPMEAALGFQGSTFKPPTPETPDPPPRPSGLGNL